MKNPPQLISRLPNFGMKDYLRPGEWVRLKDNLPGDLAGAVRRIKSVTASINTAEQPRVTWRLHFDDGRAVTADCAARYAEPREIPAHLREGKP